MTEEEILKEIDNLIVINKALAESVVGDVGQDWHNGRIDVLELLKAKILAASEPGYLDCEFCKGPCRGPGDPVHLSSTNQS
jgi:hypothetical protein